MIENKKYLPITRNKDEKGIILTYTVQHNGFTTEHNTLREARATALIIEPKDYKMKVIIYYWDTKNEGECFDDEETFCGYNTTTTLKSKTVAWQEVGKFLESLGEVAADYADGVTDCKPIAIIDAETKEKLPLDYKYWDMGDINEL